MKRTEVTSVYQLFEAWSRPLLSGAGENIRWIPLRAERIRVAPYAVLIPDFDALSASEQSLAKGFVDEYFGLSEWNFLVAAFTGRDTLTIEARPVAFPLDCRDENGRIIRPLRCMGISKTGSWRSVRSAPCLTAFSESGCGKLHSRGASCPAERRRERLESRPARELALQLPAPSLRAVPMRLARTPSCDGESACR